MLKLYQYRTNKSEFSLSVYYIWHREDETLEVWAISPSLYNVDIKDILGERVKTIIELKIKAFRMKNKDYQPDSKKIQNR